jgi:hypothetical protein
MNRRSCHTHFLRDPRQNVARAQLFIFRQNRRKSGLNPGPAGNKNCGQAAACRTIRIAPISGVVATQNAANAGLATP